MTEIRLAWCAVGLVAAGFALLALSALIVRYDRRRETPSPERTKP